MQHTSENGSTRETQNDLFDAWTPHGHEPSANTPISAYLNGFFMTIATVLGTGILGLPVKLSKSGIKPLFLVYSIIFIFQATILIFMIELLQRGRIQFQRRQKNESKSDSFLALQDIEFGTERTLESSPTLSRSSRTQSEFSDEVASGSGDENVALDFEPDERSTRDGSSNDIEVSLNDDDTLSDYDNNGTIDSNKSGEHGGEDLHNISLSYLQPILRYLFDGAIILHFVSLLITYTLAASESYGQLFGLHTAWIWLTIPFVIIYSNTVIFGSKYLEPVVTIFTFSKAGLLVLMVAITAVVSTNTDITISNDWAYIGRPFLIGTVALGGIYNILPVAFDKVKFRANQIKIFTIAALAGLTLVYLFNMAWCYFVLKIVPQVDDSNSTPPEGMIMSLADAEKNGQISTVPLVNIIRLDHKKFTWIATIIMVFTTVSITVSFIVNSMAWKHYCEGLILSWKAPVQSSDSSASASPSTLSSPPFQSESMVQKYIKKLKSIPDIWKKVIIFGGSFTFILAMALMNPKSFLQIMEKVVSLASNFTAASIAYMLYRSRSITPANIPWALGPPIYAMVWPTICFFSFAMLYNVVSTIANWAGVTWL